MRVGVDFDEVVVNQYDPWLEFNNSRDGTDITREDLYVKGSDILLDNVELKEERVQEFEDGSEEYRNMEPFNEAALIIPELAKEHHLEIITGRESSEAEHVEDIVEEYFPDCFEGIHLVGDRDYTKADICEERDLDYHIEDHPNPARECAEEGITVLMVKMVDGLVKHWNQDYEPEQDEELEKPENIEPVYSLYDVEAYLDMESN